MAKNLQALWGDVVAECPDNRDLETHSNGSAIHHQVEIAGTKVVRCETNPGNDTRDTLEVTKAWLRAAVSALRGMVPVASS